MQVLGHTFAVLINEFYSHLQSSHLQRIMIFNYRVDQLIFRTNLGNVYGTFGGDGGKHVSSCRSKLEKAFPYPERPYLGT